MQPGYHLGENSSVVGAKHLALQDPIIVIRHLVMQGHIIVEISSFAGAKHLALQGSLAGNAGYNHNGN
jgi:hypothetical protein